MAKIDRLDKSLPEVEELDFHYLLALMPMLEGIPAYGWLPELFSIIGHEKLIDLCKYAGGETIQIPTLEELSDAVEAMQWYYDVCVKGVKPMSDVPSKHLDMVQRIEGTVNA